MPYLSSLFCKSIPSGIIEHQNCGEEHCLRWPRKSFCYLGVLLTSSNEFGFRNLFWLKLFHLEFQPHLGYWLNSTVFWLSLEPVVSSLNRSSQSYVITYTCTFSSLLSAFLRHYNNCVRDEQRKNIFSLIDAETKAWKGQIDM